jgi:DNA repair exonuclease SbcCD ATPase subunit
VTTEADRPINALGLPVERRGPDWSNIAAALVPTIVMGAIVMYGGQRVLESSLTHIEREIANLAAKVEQYNQARREDIQSMDIRSANRRAEVRQEMIQLHQQQQDDLQSIREDVREVRRRN